MSAKKFFIIAFAAAAMISASISAVSLKDGNSNMPNKNGSRIFNPAPKTTDSSDHQVPPVGR